MIYALFVIFGLLPSIVWLLFYLKKDVHPESKRMVLKMFFFGMLAGVIAAIIEVAIFFSASFFFEAQIEKHVIVFFLFEQFIVIALVEELCKFFMVKIKVLDHSEFDEPVDAMLYMIITALGFAALENVLVLVLMEQALILNAVLITLFRFLGATFLHALSSGTLGYYLALSILEPQDRFKMIAKGLSIAVILHGLFNIAIINIVVGIEQRNLSLLIIALVFLVILLSGLAFFLSHCFKKVKKIASVCRVK